MENLTQVGALVLIILALCEASKMAGLKARYVPLLATVLGILGGVFFGGANWLAVVAGIITGLTTTGGYRLVKTSLLGK